MLYTTVLEILIYKILTKQLFTTNAGFLTLNLLKSQKIRYYIQNNAHIHTYVRKIEDKTFYETSEIQSIYPSYNYR